MNGRVYDYKVGRFLSVDPLIHGNGNSQGINPYSYILNNPLAGTDPSGYAPCDENGQCEFNVKTSKAGSRIVRNETVKGTLSESGGQATLNLTTGSAAAKAAVSNGVVGAGLSNGFKLSNAEGATQDLGGQESLSKNGEMSLNQSLGNNNINYVLPEEYRNDLHSEIEAAYEEFGLRSVFGGENAEEMIAKIFADAINPISMKYNVEIGALIKVDRNTGQYYLTDAVTSYMSHEIKGDTSLSAMVRGPTSKPLRTSAFLHTHSRGGVDSENFSGGSYTRIGSGSGGDLPMAAYHLANSYVATPGGRLKKFTFDNWKGNGHAFNTAVTTISTTVRTSHEKL